MRTAGHGGYAKHFVEREAKECAAYAKHTTSENSREAHYADYLAEKQKRPIVKNVRM
jgi:hypothetical protein